MSDRLFSGDVLFLQRLLSCCGLYTDTLDGDYGKHTSDAEAAFEERCRIIAMSEGGTDGRSEANIRSLQIVAQPLARRSLRALKAAGLDARIISGTRSYDEQNALFRQGRFGNPGPQVTKARGGQSWHNFGLAWDIGLFADGKYVTTDTKYKAAAVHGKVAELEWGGDWKTFPDFPHYQVGAEGRSISSARARFEAGGR